MRFPNFLQLVFIKVLLNTKAEVRNTYLNYLWWVLEPALFVAVFYLVFGILLDVGGTNFFAFLMCGKIPFLWYSRSVMNSSGSIVANRGLIEQVPIPKIFFPIVVVLQDSIKQLLVFIILFVVIFFIGFQPTLSFLYLPIIIATQFMFILASGFVVATIVPIVPDFRFIVSTGLQLLLFGSGIFYDYEQLLSAEMASYFLLNPMAFLIESYRDVLLYNTRPHLVGLGIIFFFSIVIAYLMSIFLDRYGAAYARLVEE